MSAKWLEWAKQIQAISQIGLAYSKDVYDLERYEMLRDLSLEIMSEYTDLHQEKIRDLFANETGYATPKVDIRAVVFREGKLVLVREKLDGAWALPGGWADIGLSPSEVAVKEVKEEAGLEVKAGRLLAVFDKKFHDHPESPYHVYKFFVLCTIIGGEIQGGLETSEAAFFGKEELPELSAERNTKAQLLTMFEMCEDPGRPVLLD
ncbi:NUDIX hydrolase [Paenibacillus chitinolyticus]